MIEHLVILKFREDATLDQVNAFLTAAKALKGKVEGVVDLTVGQNFTDRSKGYTHGVCVRFEDKAALERYLPHPEHVAVVESCMKPILDDVIVLDYEF